MPSKYIRGIIAWIKVMAVEFGWRGKVTNFVLCTPEAVYSSLSTISLHYYVSAVFFPAFKYYSRLATSTIHTKSQSQICA